MGLGKQQKAKASAERYERARRAAREAWEGELLLDSLAFREGADAARELHDRLVAKYPRLIAPTRQPRGPEVVFPRWHWGPYSAKLCIIANTFFVEVSAGYGERVGKHGFEDFITMVGTWTRKDGSLWSDWDTRDASHRYEKHAIDDSKHRP